MARPKKTDTTAAKTAKTEIVAAEPVTEQAETVAQTEETPKTEPAAAPAEKTFTEADVQAMIAAATAEAVAKAMENLPQQQTPQVIQIAADVEKVHFLWMAPVASDNRLTIGGENSGYAPITGNFGEFVVPKSDLSRIMDGQFREWLRRRWLIVVDGMSDEERDIYGVRYQDGELLDKMAFTRMVEMEGKILDIYPKLCDGHREMIAKAYYEAYMAKSQHVKRDVVTKLNDMSIELGSEYGDFDAVLEAMNEAERKRKN